MEDRNERLRNAKVYFVAAAGLIKIGIAFHVRIRFNALASMSPVSVSLLAIMPGGKAKERELHKRFAHLWHHGEWFEDTLELRNYIAANAKAVGKIRRPKTRSPERIKLTDSFSAG